MLPCLSLCLPVSQSDQDEDLKTQVGPLSILGVLVLSLDRYSLFVSAVDHQETLGSPEDEQKPHSTISALRRSFLEGGAGGREGMTEWEKRLASSPLRRVEDSPMIEPLEPDEVRKRSI